jgi:rod shape-determining protein MreD
MNAWFRRKESQRNTPDLAWKTRARFHWAVLVGIPLAAILFQVYVPRFVTRLSYLEMPLLVTVYFSLMYRSPIAGVLFGMGIGLGQDSLSHIQLGMFGIVKTLVGYFVASVSQRLEVENAPVRFFIALFFFMFHGVFYWVLARALLADKADLDFPQTVVLAILNAVVAVPLYRLLDRLKMVS